MIAVIWARSPHDGAHHAFDVAVIAAAAERGYAEARCTHTTPPTGLVRVAGPMAPLCTPCALAVGQDIADAGGDPGRMGRAL